MAANTDDNMYVEFRGARDMASGGEAAAALVATYDPGLATVVASLLVDGAALDASPRRDALVEALERIGRDPSPWKAAAPR